MLEVLLGATLTQRVATMHRLIPGAFALLLTLTTPLPSSIAFAERGTTPDDSLSSYLPACLSDSRDYKICPRLSDSSPALALAKSGPPVVFKNWCAIGGLATGAAVNCNPGYYRCYGTISRCLPCSLEPRIHCK